MPDLNDLLAGHPLPARIKCPFDDPDDSPAMQVYGDGRAHCFRCGAFAGSMVDLVRQQWFADLPWSTGTSAARDWLETFGAVAYNEKSQPVAVSPQAVAAMTALADLGRANLSRKPDLAMAVARARGLRDPVSLGIGLVGPELLPAVRERVGGSRSDVNAALAEAGVADPWTGRWRLGERLLVPVYQQGKCVFYQGRALDDGAPKYLNPPLPRPLFGAGSLERDTDVVWLGEGPFDVLPLLEQGEAAVAGMGADVSSRTLQEIAERARGRTVVVAYDNDEAGLAKGAQAAGELASLGCSAKLLVPPSHNDWGEWCAESGVGNVISTARWLAGLP